MLMRTPRWPLMVLAVLTVIWSAGRTWGIGFILGQTKEELKLKYDLTVYDHGTGRVTVTLTLADEGRLKPLDEVQLVIPSKEKNQDGSHWMDLVVSIDMVKDQDGKRVGRVHILKELAERAEIQLNTHTMDGKMDPMTRLHHVIPIAKYMNGPAEAPAVKPEPAPESSRKVLAELRKGTSMRVGSVNGMWLGGTVEVEGTKYTGWVNRGEVSVRSRANQAPQSRPAGPDEGNGQPAITHADKPSTQASTGATPRLDFVRRISGPVWNRQDRNEWLGSHRDARLVADDKAGFKEYVYGEGKLATTHVTFLDDRMNFWETVVIQRSKQQAEQEVQRFVDKLGDHETDVPTSDMPNNEGSEIVLFRLWRVKEAGGHYVVRCAVRMREAVDGTPIPFFQQTVIDFGALEARIGRRADDPPRTSVSTTHPSGKTVRLDLGNSVAIDLVRIEPGTFLMGSPLDEKDRRHGETQHKVVITRAFHIGITEVTQSQWQACMGTSVAQQRDKIVSQYAAATAVPSRWPLIGEGPDYPMYFVSWDEATEFCRKLSERTKRTVRLPTEAEWEYACRAGTTSSYGGMGKLDEIGWYIGNSDKKVHPVARKQPNAWGLYDMHGNANEWCSDWYGVPCRRDN